MVSHGFFHVFPVEYGVFPEHCPLSHSIETCIRWILEITIVQLIYVDILQKAFTFRHCASQ